MKVIFLDFDGVVNTLIYNPLKKKTEYGFPRDGKVNNPLAINYINALVNELDAKIVVSSTWRIGETIEGLQRILNASGFIGEIIGITPSLIKSNRGEEIESWLQDNPQVENYVIIDDNNDMLENQQKYFVKCDDAYGFQFPEYRKAKIILSGIIDAT